jgi:hypothetical protein
LRLMIGVLSFMKLLVWGVANLIPKWRERAQMEMRSNLDVIGLCLNLK